MSKESSLAKAYLENTSIYPAFSVYWIESCNFLSEKFLDSFDFFISSKNIFYFTYIWANFGVYWR